MNASPAAASPAAPSTAAVADALVRLKLTAPTVALRPVFAGPPIAGPAIPVTHLGSVDVILEVLEDAAPGSILVVDNGGRLDEACVGDLLALETLLAGFAGIVIFGLHRDSTQLVDIGLPVWSLGAFARGPIRVPPAGSAMRAAVVDGHPVRTGDWVVADDDGVVFVYAASWNAVRSSAESIIATELAQASRMSGGTSLREQIGFTEYLAIRAEQPSYSLREHLAARGGAIET